MVFLKQLLKKYLLFLKSQKHNKLKKKINDFFINNEASLKEEERLAFSYIKKHGIVLFPHSFSEKHGQLNIEPMEDESYPYVLLDEGKRLYFKENWQSDHVKSCYRGLLREQDPESPHRYLTEHFSPDADDHVFDVGAAEGIFTLFVVDKAKNVSVFEYDKDWLAALNKTLHKYQDQVTIIDKYVSNNSTKNSIKLDDMIGTDQNKLFFKIDVEGAEMKVLEGMKNILGNASKKIKILIATYHNQDDAQIIKNYLENFGFKTEFSKNFMLYYFDRNQKPPFLRRGILRATNY